MLDDTTTIGELRERIGEFVRQREWEQFHNPKDLALAIAIESAELMEIFLWKDAEEVSEVAGDADTRVRLEEELADIVILCLSLANRLEIEVARVVETKIALNEAKYPADRVRGKALKYSEYSNHSGVDRAQE